MQGKTTATTADSPGSATCEKHGPYEFRAFYFGQKQIVNRNCPKCAEASKAELEASVTTTTLGQAIAEARRQSNIPARYQSANFDFYSAETDGQKSALAKTRAFFENFDDRNSLGACLLLVGNPGTGKTHLACAIANSLIESGVACHYIGAWWAIENVKKSFADHGQLETIRAYGKFPLLIIDEIGRQWGTEAEQMILYQIINRRYEDMRPTIIISNLSAKALAEYLGEATIDRFRENGGKMIVFDWVSNRKCKK